MNKVFLVWLPMRTELHFKALHLSERGFLVSVHMARFQVYQRYHSTRRVVFVLFYAFRTVFLF